MLSGKFPQISASDYLAKEKKPDALSPSQRAFSLMADTVSSKGQIDSRYSKVCRTTFSNDRAIILIRCKKTKNDCIFRQFFWTV
jgi:hypothetical protein